MTSFNHRALAKALIGEGLIPEGTMRVEIVIDQPDERPYMRIEVAIEPGDLPKLSRAFAQAAAASVNDRLSTGSENSRDASSRYLSGVVQVGSMQYVNKKP